MNDDHSVILVPSSQERRGLLVSALLLTVAGVAVAWRYPGGSVGLVIRVPMILLFGYWMIGSMAEMVRPEQRLMIRSDGFRCLNHRLIAWADVEEIRIGQFRRLTFLLPGYAFIGVTLRDARAWRTHRRLWERMDSWLWRTFCHVDIGIPTIGLGMPPADVIALMEEKRQKGTSLE